MATDTPHQVRMALKAAARNQAPNRYQTSAGSLRPFSGVKMRAMPAKSMPQKARAKMVAHSNGPNVRVPRMSCSANCVLEKLKISKASKAIVMITPKIRPRLCAVPLSMGDRFKDIDRFMGASCDITSLNTKYGY